LRRNICLAPEENNDAQSPTAAGSFAVGQRGQARSLVGVWQSQVQTPYGMSYGRTILMPDGTFTKTFRLGQMITWDTGKYTVGQNYIHFTIEDHEPKKYMGKKMNWVKSETIFFKFLGPNKISCEDRIVGTRWVAYRAR
jgi:hypothetical protein